MTDYRTLIDVTTLCDRLDRPDWAVIDCRFDLSDPAAGRQAYRAGHIPGAHYAHLDDDLAGPVGATSGRHPLPDPQRLAERLGQWGIAADTQVVAYDEGNGATAARLWWLLGWLSNGPARCAVLDGGLRAWQAAGLGLSTQPPPPTTAQPFPAQPDAGRWVDSATVQNRSADALLFDARAAVRFRGEQEPIDPVAGHVPGAVNLPFMDNLSDGRFRPIDELRRRFEQALEGRPAEQALHMCGSGVTACHNQLAMAHAGLAIGRLYVGSWSEWLRDPGRPRATANRRV